MDYATDAPPSLSPAGAPAPAHHEPPFEWLAHLLGFLRRRGWVILLCIAAAAGLGAAYALTLPTSYTAVATVVVELRRDHPFRQQTSSADPAGDGMFIEAQSQIIGSGHVLLDVVRNLKLLDDPGFIAEEQGGGFSPIGRLRSALVRLIEPSDDPGEAPSGQALEQMAAERLSGMLTVRRTGGTTLLSVSIRARNGALAARLANAICESYIAAQLDAIGNNTRRASVWLQERIQELQAAARAADRDVQDYRARNNIVSTEKGLINEQQLAELSSQLTLARARTSEAQARWERIRGVAVEGLQDAAVSEMLQSSLITSLRQQYLELGRREAEWSERFGPRHSALIPIQREMAAIKGSIASELGRIAETARTDLEGAQSNEAAVTRQLAGLVRGLTSTNADRIELRSLESAAATYRQMYESFLQRYTQAVQDQSYPIADARVVDEARPPLHRNQSRRVVIVMAAAVAGMGMGILLAFGLDATDRRLRTPQQLRQATGLELIAVLPRLSRRDRDRAIQPPRAGAGGAPTRFSEAMHGLEARVVQQCRRTPGATVIGCFAALPGAGASTVAAGLAALLAESGHRTILADLDFRTSGLTRLLAPQAGPGFLDVVSDGALLAEAVVDDVGGSGMAFMPRGRAAPAFHPASSLGSVRAQTVLAALRADHDFVVVDLPALGPFPDTHAAIAGLDACILVFEWGGPGPTEITEILRRFDPGGAVELGAVMTKVHIPQAARYVSPVEASSLRAV